MTDGKRRLPIVTGGSSAPEAAPVEREWHWVPLSAVLVSALSIALLFVVLPPMFEADLKRAYGDEVPTSNAERLEGLQNLPKAQAEAMVVRMVVVSTVVFAIAALSCGIVVGRFKRAPGRAEVVFGMLSAAFLFAFAAGQLVAVVWLAPTLVLPGLLGGLAGARLRARALSPKPQAPPD